MFDAREVGRLERSLERISPYFGNAGVALTGGVAVAYHLAAAGRPGTRTTLADLDFVARRIDGLERGIAREFLVSHYHRVGPDVPKALVQLVDSTERLRIDIFPDLDDAVASAFRATVGNTPLPILSIETILEHKLRTLRKATASDPVDPKHWRDAQALAAISGCALSSPTAHLRRSVLGNDVMAICSRCERSRDPQFPLAPKSAILALLGYV